MGGGGVGRSVYICVFVFVGMCVCQPVCVFLCVCVYMCVFLRFSYVCVRVCVCLGGAETVRISIYVLMCVPNYFLCVCLCCCRMLTTLCVAVYVENTRSYDECWCRGGAKTRRRRKQKAGHGET